MSIQIPSHILNAYGLSPDVFGVEKIGSGHIHFTFKLVGSRTSYILQRVNKNVFRKPDVIASNLRVASTYLKNKFPDYLFLTPISTKAKEEMVYDDEGFPWRLFPFYADSFTIDKVATSTQAYNAAAE